MNFVLFNLKSTSPGYLLSLGRMTAFVIVPLHSVVRTMASLRWNVEWNFFIKCPGVMISICPPLHATFGHPILILLSGVSRLLQLVIADDVASVWKDVAKLFLGRRWVFSISIPASRIVFFKSASGSQDVNAMYGHFYFSMSEQSHGCRGCHWVPRSAKWSQWTKVGKL